MAGSVVLAEDPYPAEINGERALAEVFARAGRVLDPGVLPTAFTSCNLFEVQLPILDFVLVLRVPN